MHLYYAAGSHLFVQFYLTSNCKKHNVVPYAVALGSRIGMRRIVPKKFNKYEAINIKNLKATQINVQFIIETCVVKSHEQNLEMILIQL